MSKKIVQNIVIFLAILIILSFLALIYGISLKISTPAKNLSESITILSSNLNPDEKIKNIEVLDKNTLFILIQSGNNLNSIIYDIKNDNIINLTDK
tara:strand:+ start:3895 stop:4182 length:288 start_codon:yes stop_codon:yes gene_type:complete